LAQIPSEHFDSSFIFLMIRLVIAFLCAAAACMLVASALTTAQAPANSTPDSFVSQITHTNRDSFAGDVSANGRFVVIESNGDIATEKIPTFNASGTPNVNPRNNEDGNRELFLFDYAQRRIFQLTNTKSVLNPPGSPSPTPSPSPSPSPSVSPTATPTPTASPTPTPVDPSNVAIEVSNNQPMITLEPALVTGQRTYTIVFSSNAPVSPASFDGTSPGGAVATDMNQEIWTYKFTVPEIPQSALASGAEVGPIDLTTGTFTRVTNTPASAAPVAGSTTSPPRVAFDNRDATISDDGTVIAFSSNRDLVAGGNVDADAVPPGVANPEIFLYRPGTGTFTQVTNTKSTSFTDPIFNSNPCLSSNGSVLAFVSNANISTTNTDLNAEVYLANFNSATGVVSGLKQVTKTLNDTTTHATTNGFQFGRRLSRDGNFIAFESAAEDPKANAAPTKFPVSFVYNVQADTFAQVGPRSLTGDILHFPTFTDYDGALRPASVIFTSALNFNTDGSFPTEAQDPTTGLNTRHVEQLFLAPLPAISTGPFTRLTNLSSFVAVRGIPSNVRSRIVMSITAEIGGGNPDGSVETFYLLSPAIVTESTGTLTASTGASRIPVPVASPTAPPTASPSPSPSPSPTPTGSPTPAAAPGLAPGELGFFQSSASLSDATVTVNNSNASESGRAPALPIELNGVSVAINNAACGLYAVASGEIKFVVPIGLAPGTYNIVINNKGTAVRGSIVIVPSQPDIFTSTNVPLGRAKVCNITNPAVCTPEPFFVTTNDGTGTQVPTILRVSLTGIRNNLASSITVRVGTTVMTPFAARSTDLPGTDEFDFTLVSTVDTGDLPIVVAVGGAGSRPDDTAPHITINAGGSPAPNPIVTTDFFVRQQYLDFLNREPDAPGFAFWTNQINSCGNDQQCIEIKRINVSAAFFLSVEFQQTGYLVYRTYKAAYGNIPSTPVPVRLSEFLPDTRQIGHDVIVNQTGWESLLESNKVAFFNDFVQRSRFTTAFSSGLTAQQFVDQLYTNAGLAPASGTNRAAAVSEFNSTTPADAAARARALRLVAEDPMVAQQEFNRAFVLMEYFGYLQRNPNDAPEATLDFAGYNFWLSKLNQFNGNFVNAEMVKAFITSTEYKQRFGL
jgi:uncharacterized protein (TIGR03437 family)